MDSKMIYELLKELKGDVKEIGSEQKIHGKELAKQSVILNHLEKDVKRNTDNIEDHMYRTELSEAAVALLKDLHQDNQKRIGKNEEKIADLQAPVQAKVWLVKKVLKYIGVLSAISGAAYGIIKIIQSL